MKKFKFALKITEKDLRKFVRFLVKIDNDLYWETIDNVKDTLYKCACLWAGQGLDKITDLWAYMNDNTENQMCNYMLDYYKKLRED